MKFAWLQRELQQVCTSEKLLRKRFGDGAAAVQFVFSVLAQSDTLRDVRTFRSLHLSLIRPTARHPGRLRIQHKEIDVITELLDDGATTVYDTDSDSSDWINPIRRLRIISVTSNA